MFTAVPIGVAMARLFPYKFSNYGTATGCIRTDTEACNGINANMNRGEGLKRLALQWNARYGCSLLYEAEKNGAKI